MKPEITLCPQCNDHPVIMFELDGKVVSAGFHSKCEVILAVSVLKSVGYISPKEMLRFTGDILNHPALPDTNNTDKNTDKPKSSKISTCASLHNPKTKEAWSRMN